MRLDRTWLARVGCGSLLLWGLVSVCGGATQFPQRPFVLVNEEELAALRSDLSRPGWKAELYRSPRGFSVMSSGRGVRANADLWLRGR